jgi:tRNA U38,U39,U40 pseudouridine synthase TruA
MARYFIELSYDGALFGGFQIQQNKATVQGALENAMENLI